MRDDAAIQEALGTLGAAIRAARKERGFTQEGFAARAGIDRSYFGAIERGLCESTLKTLLRLRQGLGSLATVFARLEREAGEQDASFASCGCGVDVPDDRAVGLLLRD